MATRGLKITRERVVRIVQRLNERASKMWSSRDKLATPALTDPKAQAELGKVQAETSKLYASMIGPSLVALGIILVFLYAFFVSHSFPSGVSAGDTLFFLLIAEGYVLCSSFLTFFGYMLFSPWVARFRPTRGPVQAPGGIMARAGAVLESQNILLGLTAAVAQLLLAFAAGTILRWGLGLRAFALTPTQIVGLVAVCS